jgi:hypothetical protein
MSSKCYDCGCAEGELHEFGCECEVCPFCGQDGFIGCDCLYNHLGYMDSEIEPTDEQWKERFQKEREILEKKGRIPYIHYPLLCAKCGTAYPVFFTVSDREWNHYIQPDIRDSILCLACYEHIKQAIDAAGYGIDIPDRKIGIVTFQGPPTMVDPSQAMEIWELARKH